MSSRKLRKQLAQDMLMSAMVTAFNSSDVEEGADEEKVLLRQAMSEQMARIEKLFGYDVYSWDRGC